LNTRQQKQGRKALAFLTWLGEFFFPIFVPPNFCKPYYF